MEIRCKFKSKASIMFMRKWSQISICLMKSFWNNKSECVKARSTKKRWRVSFLHLKRKSPNCNNKRTTKNWIQVQLVVKIVHTLRKTQIRVCLTRRFTRSLNWSKRSMICQRRSLSWRENDRKTKIITNSDSLLKSLLLIRDTRSRLQSNHNVR